MDYRRIYKQLCDRGQIRVKEEGVFYERHHIKPRSFGGRKTKDNLTLLTLKEHYMAHLLLARIYPDSPAMQRALWNMCNINPKNKANYERYKPSSNMYNLIRSDYRRMCSGINSPTYGTKMSEEHKEKLRFINTNRKHAPKPHSKSTIEKIRQRAIGRKATEKAIMSNKLANRGGKSYKAKRIMCKVTGEVFGSGRELSEHLNKPFSTIRRWLNGTTKPPIEFHYMRIDNKEEPTNE